MITRDYFTVANRNLALISTSFSIAASWVAAPSLFLAAQQAYTNGIPGFMWFFIPNLIGLLTFAFMSPYLLDRNPNGYTISEVMGKMTSKRVQMLYWFALIAFPLSAFATQLIAGSGFLKTMTNIEPWRLTIFIGLIPLSYVIIWGLKASVITDAIKMVILASMCLTLSYIAIEHSGIQALKNGFSGVKHNSTSFFDSHGIDIAIGFGIPSLISLVTGPIGDQTFWQRAFATPKENRVTAFLLGSLWFSLVPISMGIIGFLAAGIDLQTSNPQMINLEYVVKFLPEWAYVALGVMVFVCLLSIMDSKLCAISSIVTNDMASGSVWWGRTSMVAFTIAGILVANIPGLKIIHLFLIQGTIRAATFIPTMYAIITGKAFHEAGVFWGVLTSVAIFLPIMAYGSLNNIPSYTLVGALGSFLASGLIAWVITQCKQSYQHTQDKK